MQARNCLADPDRLSTEMNVTARESAHSIHLMPGWKEERGGYCRWGFTPMRHPRTGYPSASILIRHNIDAYDVDTGRKSPGKGPF